MNEKKERKEPYYRQSGFAFMFIGISFSMLAVCIFADWAWAPIAFWLSVAIDVAYALASSRHIEQRK